ncbi:N-succinylarginine dihydrolase [Rosistilla carotiformis]|uniref:N-succinylarginine dihydrolase n=1 Tax=Rosistilla carotiformis TaxID=2528017 RepID=A0A518JPY0_9BACT|nr:N-succinylarginine dihydrolase [Rosistilla carotiformis]QDV67597.1 N-succinylarginine dihydrolase [Rosistilla carotiformis]
MTIFEINFDGIVGPTHHFGGLGIGNLASHRHAGEVANPRAAALQGLDKMAMLAELGCRQAVLPPQPRPDLELLRGCGFDGTPAEIIRRARDESPSLLSAAYSASNMWAANAATVTRSGRSGDRATHFTPANLISSLHRSIEPKWTTVVLREIFAASCFRVHDPLPPATPLRDEGAANHMRLSDPSGEDSWDLLVYGEPQGTRFPPRQSLTACHAIARRHRLAGQRTLFLQQHPDAIDAGAFHNDVVATSCENVLLYHEQAFVDASDALERLDRDFHQSTGRSLYRIEVAADDFSLHDAIATYLFNSQIVRCGDNRNAGLRLICPRACEQHPRARDVIDQILRDPNPIDTVHFVDLHESMNNGGGPACLRLRVPVDEAQAVQIPASVLWSPQLDEQLRAWVIAHYPTKLTVDDLGDIDRIEQTQAAMRALSSILDLRSLSRDLAH